MRGYTFAASALIAGLFLLLGSMASAQFNRFSTRNFGGATIHGTPPSVTSFGFGGRPGFTGVPPSVTSLNFGNVRFTGPRLGFRPGRIGFRHHHHQGFFSPYLIGGYYIPYLYADDAYSGYSIADTGVDDSMEENYRGGPTIFDRHGPGTREYPRPQPADEYRAEQNQAPQKSQEPPPPVADQPTTVLIFKDGHELEVRNYAIVGGTLYDLSDGRTHKVELAQLDLPATVKQNDDRGVSFQLPAGTKLN
jgi:hypothetical protein